MREFKINDSMTAICESKNTRNGFKHEATLLINGYEVATSKICYLNRTWEAFEFESVLFKLFDCAEAEHKKAFEIWKQKKQN